MVKNNKKYTIEDVKIVAESKGGKCLSTEYKNSKSPLEFQCGDCGNIWKTQFVRMKIFGEWCPNCAIINGRHTLEYVKKVAQDRGYICLSEEYVSGETHMLFKCKCGNVKETTFFCF
jgi:hypothetical protein